MKKISAIILLILMCSISVITFAANEYSVQLDLNKQTFKAGETVELSVNIEDITTQEGVAAFSAIIDYDSSIFELSEAKETEEWDTPILVDDMVQATRKDMLNSKENQKAAIVTLKVREDAKLGKTTIGLSKFDATDGYKTMRNSGTSVDIEVVSENQTNTQSNSQNGNIFIIIIIAVVVLAVIIGAILIIRKRK